ncbi:ribonuclease P protein component [Buchnera aphidicola]|uniref:ribonuclease P protein component n=1 Tax=Buchnera aphidicola TaxID=9 RepID=UPI0034638599
MLNYFFKKKSRLLKSKNFKYVFSNPYSKNTFQINVLSRFNLLDYPRLGLSVSRKNIKDAYKRNTIKRVIRETFRLLQHELISMDFIVIAKKNIIYLNNKNIMSILENIWSNYHR